MAIASKPFKYAAAVVVFILTVCQFIVNLNVAEEYESHIISSSANNTNFITSRVKALEQVQSDTSAKQKDFKKDIGIHPLNYDTRCCFHNASRQGMLKPRNWGSSRSNTGNTHRIHELLLQDTGAKVLVMGGSMTAGSEVGGLEYAWPALLANITEFSGLTITNRAQGSTGTTWFLQNLGTQLAPFDWDVVMIEAAMNDDDVCHGCRYSSESEVTTQFEALVRGIRIILPQAAVIIVEAFRQSKAPRNGFTSGQNQHDMISKYYELPVISIRDAIWHDYDEDIRRNRGTPLTRAFPQKGRDERQNWSGAHPAREGQQLITDIVAHELCRFRNEPPSSKFERNLAPPLLIKKDVDITSHWLHSFQFESLAYKPYNEVYMQTKGWHHTVQQPQSDNPKPGLICNNTQPNYVTFNVTGCKSTFYISFTKSYGTFGTASVVFDGQPTENNSPSNNILLESRWDRSKGSARHPEVIQFEDHEVNFSTLTISLLPDEDKDKRAFKLLEVRCV